MKRCTTRHQRLILGVDGKAGVDELVVGHPHWRAADVEATPVKKTGLHADLQPRGSAFRAQVTDHFACRFNASKRAQLFWKTRMLLNAYRSAGEQKTALITTCALRMPCAVSSAVWRPSNEIGGSSVNASAPPKRFGTRRGWFTSYGRYSRPTKANRCQVGKT